MNTFRGDEDSILNSNIIGELGCPVYSMLATICSIEDMTLSDIMCWVRVNPELDSAIRRISGERSNLELVCTQFYFMARRRFAIAHKEVLEQQVEQLENNLQHLHFKNTAVLKKLIGRKKRLLRLVELANQESTNQESTNQE